MTTRAWRSHAGSTLRSEADVTGLPELLKRAKGDTRDDVLWALRDLKRHRTPEVATVVEGLVGHADPRVRAAAWRTLRSVASRQRYLEVSAGLLTDRRRGVRRVAARVVGFGRFVEGVPLLVERLLDSDYEVRRAAADALRAIGAPALAALERAKGRARPDRRNVYAAVLDANGHDLAG